MSMLAYKPFTASVFLRVFFLEVNLETFVCLTIIEKQCSLVIKIMDSGASLSGSNSNSAIYYLCDLWHVFLK